MGYACVKQVDQSDCGAAALATVALHHKKSIPLQAMRDLAGTDRVGTNLLGLLRAAENLGFDAKGVKGPYDALGEVALPAIAHWVTEEGLGHFVVLHRVSKDRAVVADPGRGILKLTREQFCARWTGYLLILAPREAFFAREDDKPFGPWGRFRTLLRPHRGVMLEAFFCALLLTVLGLASSYFIQHLVDSVLVHGEGRLLNALAAGMLSLTVFRCLFGVLRQYLLAHVSRKVDLSLISGYARHVLHQPMKFFELRRVGEILSRVNDAVKVREAVSGTTLTIIVDATLILVSLVVMFVYDWPLALVAGAVLPVFLLTVLLHQPATKKHSRQAMEKAAQLQAHLVEDVNGVDTIKAFGAERRRAEEGEASLYQFVKSVFSIQKIQLSMGSLGMFFTAAAGIVILWYGGHRTIDGVLTIGQLMFFHSLLGHMLEPVERLSGVNTQIQDALIAVDRFGEILDLETEKLSEEHKAAFRGVSSAIALDRVSFRYGCRAEVLKKMSLTIPAGRTVAIVGESGSGKSTLLKLLARFYDPTDGRVTADGMDLRDFTLESLRSKIGLVSQEPFLFSGTIRDNLAFGRPDATMEEVVEAARAAQLDEFIQTLPQRYDTVVGERGANLSGGQRQRLAIARALLTKPEILIFDEATSHLDTATERALQQTMEDAFAGKTVILVAHRLSTVRKADYLYVMHQGEILEHGTHDELMEARGYYASLWSMQAEESEEPVLLLDGDASARFFGKAA